MILENYRLAGDKLNIHTYPDPVLSKKAAEVTIFDDSLEMLVKNMLFTMYHAPGIGLAAPQIGQGIRLFVIDVDYDREKILNSSGQEVYEFKNLNPQIFINPKIEGIGDKKIMYEEGCLSVPGIYDEVERFEKIHVHYHGMKGEKLSIAAEGLLSICLQHENDHLEGVVFIERLSSLKKNFYKKKILKEKQKK